jgi:acyl-CoA reductase-like NAD-dependent aldehyde dehydrogenase
MSTSVTPELKRYTQLLIGGEWVSPSGDELIEVVSPSTEEVVATLPDPQIADAERAIAAARTAFDQGPWPHLSPQERGEAVGQIASNLTARANELAAAFTADFGVPASISPYINQAGIDVWHDYAAMARTLSLEEERRSQGRRVRILREPVGVVLALTPWNGPMPMAALKLAPALLAGCTVVLKPAPEAPLTTMILAEILAESDLPPGVASVLPAGRSVSEHMVRHADVDKVTFTGSTATGRRIMALCSARIANVTLELGGKSAAIILDDAEPADVVPLLMQGSIMSSGQVCTALTRVLVSERRHAEWVDALAAMMRSAKVGDPNEPDTLIGPLVSSRQRDRVEEYIAAGREEGARVVVGGRRPEGLDRGYYVEPTLFDGVQPWMRIAQEEIFGPVVSILTYRDVDEAVRIANDSIYGLSGAVFTQDIQRGYAIARRLRSGTANVNSFGACLTQPFGGCKQSGLGREGGHEGLDQFFELKQIQIPADAVV